VGSKGVKGYTEKDLIIEEKTSQKDDSIFWSKSIELEEQFSVGGSIHRKKEHTGFGLWARKRNEKGFSWEWFKRGEHNQEGTIYEKLQGSGEVEVTFKQIEDSKEVSRILFHSDVVLRYLSDPESKNPTHLIIVRKGSVLDFGLDSS
jgi:hypothetical protein